MKFLQVGDDSQHYSIYKIFTLSFFLLPLISPSLERDSTWAYSYVIDSNKGASLLSIRVSIDA